MIKSFFCAFLFILCLAQTSAAQTNVEQTYTLRSKAVEIVTLLEENMTLSKSCMRKKKNKLTFDCMASRALNRKPFKDLPLEGGQNPGAVICTQIKGQVVWGKDQKQNELTFCEFPDMSYVSTGTLTNKLFFVPGT